MNKGISHTQKVLQGLSIQKAIERQEQLNALIQKVYPAVWAHQDILSMVQQNLTSPLVALQPVLEQYRDNSAMVDFLNNFSNQIQSIVPLSLREQAAMNMGTSLEIFGNACRELCESIASTSQIGVVTQWTKMLNLPEYTSSFDNWKAIQVDWLDLISRVQIADEEENYDDGFLCNEEIHVALEEHIKNPMRFQEKVACWTEKMKKQYYLVCLMLSLIGGIFVLPYLQDIGKTVTAWTVAHVKELPSMAGNFIMDLKDGIEAIIIENSPYYYKVSFVDENGEEKEGYVSKRSVRIIEKTEEAEDECKE